MEREETHAHIDARARARIRTHTRAPRDGGGGGGGGCWKEGSSSLPSREQTKRRTSERASERSGIGAWRARDCVCVRSANHPPPTGAPIVYRDDGLALPNEKRIPLSCKRAPFPAATVAAATATGVSPLTTMSTSTSATTAAAAAAAAVAATAVTVVEHPRLRAPPKRLSWLSAGSGRSSPGSGLRV